MKDQNLAAKKIAARSLTTNKNHYAETTTRLIARIARIVAAEQRCADYTAFKDALRCRLLQLRIRYQPAAFDDAVSIVAANTRLWGAAPATALPPDRLQSAPAILSKADAAAVLAQLRCRVRTMPQPRADASDQALALGVILDAIVEQTARVDALERREP